jgi:hypothetical protein
LVVNSGIILFFCLYFTAALNYPGGSKANAYSVGFSWTNNYWCDLLDQRAINGEVNSARPISLSAMGVLCFTLTAFWYWVPTFMGMGKSGVWIIRWSGFAAMATSVFLFFGPHDRIINIASFFGIISVIGTLAGLHMLKWKNQFWAGILNLGLVGMNNIFYYNPDLLTYLPVLQKLTFIAFLSWVFSVSYRIYCRMD